MRAETKEFLKENFVRINEKVQHARDKVHLDFVKNALIKLYFASPSKIQFALARYGMKAILNKKKEEPEELIKH
jgi:hypothetical protein